MFNTVLYSAVLIAWGGSWLAIKWQEGPVPVALSILYRFGLATVMMLLIVILLGKLQKTSRRDQFFCLLQGLCLFSLNFLAFYQATHYIASGLVAVVMSTATLFNALHNRLIWNTRPAASFRLGAVLGIAGLSLLFWSDLVAQQWSLDSLKGIGFALLGTWLFSLGNMVGVRHGRAGVTAFTSTSWGMLYGCAILALLIPLQLLAQGESLSTLTLWDPNPQYLTGLLYLAVIASVVGFTTYLMLISRIGANNAAYALVITPILALTLSSVFEYYQWTGTSLAGLAVIMLGNVVVMGGLPRLSLAVNQRRGRQPAPVND